MENKRLSIFRLKYVYCVHVASCRFHLINTYTMKHKWKGFALLLSSLQTFLIRAPLTAHVSTQKIAVYQAQSAFISDRGEMGEKNYEYMLHITRV